VSRQLHESHEKVKRSLICHLPDLSQFFVRIIEEQTFTFTLGRNLCQNLGKYVFGKVQLWLWALSRFQTSTIHRVDFFNRIKG
jgi:hypothetical protein